MMPDELTHLPYTFEPVGMEDVPPRHGHRAPSRYLKIVQDFLASGHVAARLNIDWPEGMTNGAQESFVNGLKQQVKRYTYPLIILRRRGEIYVVRQDLPVVGHSETSPKAR